MRHATTLSQLTSFARMGLANAIKTLCAIHRQYDDMKSLCRTNERANREFYRLTLNHVCWFHLFACGLYVLFSYCFACVICLVLPLMYILLCIYFWKTLIDTLSGHLRNYNDCASRVKALL